MRKARLVQLGILAGFATTALAVGSIAGCSSDDNGTTVTGGEDSGTGTDATTDSNTSNPDTGTGTDAGVDSAPAPQDAKLILVHAAPGLGAVRLCFQAATGSGTIVYPAPPQPDTAIGVPPGTGGVFPDFGIDLSGYAITAYAIPAANLPAPPTDDAGPAEETCDKIFAGDAGTPGVDYFPMQIASGTLLQNNTYLLSLTGCPANVDDAGFSAALCGSGYDGGNSVALGVAQLDTTTDAGTGIGVQFAQRSPQIQGLAATADTTALGVPGVNPVHPPATAGVIPGILYTDVEDGGAEAGAISSTGFIPLDTSETPIGASPTTVVLSTATVIPQLTTSDPSAGFSVVLTPGTEDGGAINPNPWPGGDFFGLSLGDIQYLSTGAPPSSSGPAYFSAGQSYTFVLVGNPQETLGAGFINDAGKPDFAPGSTPTLGLHFVAFPNNPTITVHLKP